MVAATLAGCLAAGLAGEQATPRSDVLALRGFSDSSLGRIALHVPGDYSATAATFLQETAASVALALTTRFGPVNPAPFQLVVVESRAQLQDWLGHALPRWIHAVASEHPPRVVILGPDLGGRDRASQRFEMTLFHELAHIYLYRLPSGREGESLPGWFHEGLAVYVSGGLDRGMHQALIRGRVTGKYYALAELRRIYHTSPALSQLAYAQSLLAIQSMEEFYGDGVFRELFDSLRRGASFAEAFVTAAGVTPPQFQDRYQQALRHRYNPLMIITDPGAVFILLPLLLVVAYFVRQRRNRAIRARWLTEGETGWESETGGRPGDHNAEA